MRAKVIASIYAILAISFWGVSFVSTKALLVKMDPFTLVVLRFGIAALFLLVILMLSRRKLAVPLQYVPHLIVLGILGVFIHQVVQSTALLTIDASSAGWLISLSPIFTVILSILFLHEKMNLTRAAGMIVAVIGVMLVTTTRSGQSFDFSMNLGFSLMILSTLNWAIYSILLKKLNIPIPALVVTFYMSVVGFLLTLPFILRNRGWESLPLLDSSEWAHLAFLAVFVSGVGYWY
jgi:drug/metabolite transporter (DMT)-like permease